MIISIGRFYSKNIRTVPRKMISSVELLTSVDGGGNEEEKENFSSGSHSERQALKNFSSTSHSERHALRDHSERQALSQLLALVGSQEATLVSSETEVPVLSTTATTTTTRKPVLITTSAPRIRLSSTSSTTNATTQESDNFILQMTNKKETGKINNNKLNNSDVEDGAKIKPKDFLLKMMLFSQDTNSVTKSDLASQPSDKAKVETKKKEEVILKKDVLGIKKDAWQAVSSLTTIFDGGNEEKKNVSNEEDGFGDNLQLIFMQDDDTQQAGQEPILHVDHGEVEPELRIVQDSDQLSLDSGRHNLMDDHFNSAQEENIHHHQDHLARVVADFKPAVAISEYGSQWLPVFSPSHRVAR